MHYVAGVAALHERLLRNLHHFYLVLIGPCAVTFCFLVPPLQVPDESHHLIRSVQVSKGHLVGWTQGDALGGAYLPHVVEEFTAYPGFNPELFEPATSHGVQIPTDGKARLRKLQWHPSDDNFVRTPFISYPPTSYLASAAGLRISRMKPLDFLSSFYLGRLFSTGFALLLSAYTIRSTQSGKLLVFSILSTPMALSLFGSYSQDSAIIAYAALALGMLNQWINRAESPMAVGERSSNAPQNGRMLLVVLLFSAVIAARPPYCLLAMIVPIVIYATTKKVKLGILSLVAMAALPAIWFLIVRPMNHPSNFYGVDPAAQLAYLREHTDKILDIVLLSFRVQSPHIGKMFIGLIGSRGLWLSPSSYAIYACALGFSLLHGTFATRNRLSFLARFGVLSSLISMLALLMSFAYMLWSRVGAPAIHGIHGRYLLIPALFLSLLVGSKFADLKNRYVACMALAFLVTVIGLVTVVDVKVLLDVTNYYYYCP